MLHGIRFLRKLNHPEGLVYACFDPIAKVRSVPRTLRSSRTLICSIHLIVYSLELYHTGREGGALLRRGRPPPRPRDAADRLAVRPHSARTPARGEALTLRRLEVRAQRRSGRTFSHQQDYNLLLHHYYNSLMHRHLNYVWFCSSSWTIRSRSSPKLYTRHHFTTYSIMSKATSSSFSARAIYRYSPDFKLFINFN